MKHYILILFTLLSFSIYCQKPNVINNTEIKPKHKNATKVSIKIGMTCNTINKAIYKDLNKNLSSELYKSDNVSFFINPYVSIGIEEHLKRNFGFNFNIGFYQTLQKYTNIVNYKLQNPNYSNKYYEITSETKCQYLNNNIFLELLPTYQFKHTTILAGFNATRNSPTIKTVTTVENKTTSEIEGYSYIDRPEESYHVYSMLGIMQCFPIKKHEFTISATYFGFLKKYDSGLNLCLGFLF